MDYYFNMTTAVKVFISCLGLGVAWFFPSLPLWMQAFMVGVLPIWAELASSRITATEPARLTSRRILFLDAAADSWAFLLAPILWVIWIEKFNFPLAAALALFLAAGLYRIGRFLKTGLDPQGYFQGLPVTYTGYAWLIFAIPRAAPWFAGTLLIILGVAMVSRKKFLRAPQP